MIKNRLKLCLIIVALLALAGCKQGRILAPVSEGWQADKAKENLYSVQVGDSLYSIAWAFDVDYRHLAKVNHLQAPYDLQTGQKLQVFHREIAATAKPSAKNVQVKKPVNQIGSPLSNQASVEREEKSDEKRHQINKKPNYQKDSEWHWPAQGELVGRFSEGNAGQRGIDIAAIEGSPVFATQDGSVVYSGSGLRGYGKLLIVKHNNEFLSAYAHNSEVLVQEGQTVSKGQQIAAMGKTGAGSVKLHFEIRRAGQPVDPLKYLKMEG